MQARSRRFVDPCRRSVGNFLTRPPIHLPMQGSASDPKLVERASLLLSRPSLSSGMAYRQDRGPRPSGLGQVIIMKMMINGWGPRGAGEKAAACATRLSSASTSSCRYPQALYRFLKVSTLKSYQLPKSYGT